MVIIETHIFRSQIDKLLDREEFRDFQNHLVLNPGSGGMIKGSGGIRKIRWRKSKSGKRGGIRILYYYVTDKGVILLLLAYSKRKTDDLTPGQLKILKKLVKEELGNG